MLTFGKSKIFREIDLKIANIYSDDKFQNAVVNIILIQMRQRVLKVLDSFIVAGKGTVITGELENNVFLNFGTPIFIVRPDNSEIKNFIVGIEQYKKWFSKKQTVGLLLKDTEKSDVPNGSEIFIEV